MMKKAGFIIMGSAESRAAYQDMIDALGSEVQVTLMGVLDGLRPERVGEVYAFAPGESYIVTEVPWGGTVHISESKARCEVLRIAEAMYADGVQSVLVICTGRFERPQQPGGLFYLPEDMLCGLLSGLGVRRVGFLVPEPAQIAESQQQYRAFAPAVRAASPYGPPEQIEKTAALFRDEPVELIVTDCMGFTPAMGQRVARVSGKQVLVPRLVIPRLLRAALLQQ